MRSHLITAAVAIAAIALVACLYRSSPPAAALRPAASALADGAHERDAARAADPHRGASEISWFQGTFEEGFARPHHRGSCPLLHY